MIKVDVVEQFVSENKHQLGYIMQVASNQWKEVDPCGALTVGTTASFENKYGSYHKILDELELRKKYEVFLINAIKTGEVISEIHSFEWFCEKNK